MKKNILLIMCGALLATTAIAIGIVFWYDEKKKSGKSL